MKFNKFNDHVDILHVIGSLTAGGAEKLVIDLLVNLKNLNMNVGLLALSSRKDKAGEKMATVLKQENIPYECGPSNRVRIRSAIWYLNKVRKIKPDIVHLHTENTELAHYLACRVYKTNHKIFRTIHNVIRSDKGLFNLAFYKNDIVLSIACSDAVKQEYQKRLKSKVVTIQNGIGFTWPIQTAQLKVKYRNELLLKENEFHFVHVGSQNGDSMEHSQKAQDILIKAWKLAKLQEKNCNLHFLGDGNLRQQFERLSDGDKSIHFHGVIANVHSWLLAADCYVMPSRNEGLPIAGIEAVATGIPCVFSNIAPLQELGAKSVLWSDVDDIEKLADNLIKIRNNQLKVSIIEVEDIRKRYSIAKTAARYHHWYAQY